MALLLQVLAAVFTVSVYLDKDDQRPRCRIYSGQSPLLMSWRATCDWQSAAFSHFGIVARLRAHIVD